MNKKLIGPNIGEIPSDFNKLELNRIVCLIKNLFINSPFFC